MEQVGMPRQRLPDDLTEWLHSRDIAVERRYRQMTVDERIERLTARHEALTQTIEIMVIEHRESVAETRKRFSEVIGAIESLAKIAESHERRIEDLEA